MDYDLKIFVRVAGQRLIRQNRAALRGIAAGNTNIAKAITSEVQSANDRAREQNRLSWMR
jgi:hypothetical protein